MSLTAGARLGPYEIVSPLGAGGMGEVYKARDTRLGRDVAIKVLPSHLSDDPELKARFEREARAISQLTHPHICTLYDVGETQVIASETKPSDLTASSGTTVAVQYLVMELLEGQTLAERLEKGPLPVEQVLRSAVEIADALDKAHRAGIVHRDLKPGNIMMTRSGVKLLDFGLAKAAAGQGAVDSQLSSLPTEAERPLTERGTILGTFQYMAPEQLEGKEADARSDIFAFGCVLYEMATAQKAFTGASRVSLISSILRDDPRPISVVAPMTPPAFDRVVKTCLAKDPEERWQSARDVKSELQWISEAGSQAGAPAVIASRRKSRERLAWVCAGVAAVAAALLAAGYIRRAPREGKPILAVLLPPEKVFVTDLALSPDGSKLAFCAVRPGSLPGLWIRTLSEPAGRPVPETEGAMFPFWSPDGRFVAFFSQGALKRVDASGGPLLTICDAERGAGGAWGSDGTILFALPTSPIFRVAASGGKPVPVTKLDSSLHVTAHRYPSFLPDGRHFLYMAADLSASASDSANSIRVGSLDGKLDRAIVPVASNAAYADGRLFYGRDGALLAQKFDVSRWEVKGDPETVSERVSQNGWFAFTLFSVSGPTLVCLPLLAVPLQLTWVDRNGRSLGVVGEPRAFNNGRLSPDGRRIVADVFDPGKNKREIWMFDVAGGAGTRFVSSNWGDQTPVWSPQGDRIVFASGRRTKGTKFDLWTKRLDGSPEELFLESPDGRNPEDWSPDGRILTLNVTPATGKRTQQLWVAETGGAHKVVPFAADADFQGSSRISPDGRWIAYVSNESGKIEIYVRPFPEGPGRWQISTSGGASPVWRRDGKELYFESLDFKVTAVPISASPTFRAGPPAPLFDLRSATNGLMDVPAGEGTFLVALATSDQISPPFSLVLNWRGLLRKE
ncbi:MAG: protein kinase domain-containing protein [Thermoanaerobaculia bacterium]